MPDIAEIIRKAREAGASDVHILAGSPPAMRISRELSFMSMPRMSSADMLEMLLDILTEHQRDCFEQWGGYETAVSLPGAGRCRVNAFRQQGHVAMAIRLIGGTVPSLEELGIPETMGAYCDLQQGLVLVAGASGHGRTATLAAMVDRINSRQEVSIVTLEKPLSYLHPHKSAIVSQREVGTDVQDFPEALKQAMRADADVIAVDEIEDLRTLEEAVLAAVSGHLVLAAVIGSDWQEIWDRLTASLPEQKQRSLEASLDSVLQAVILQRMTWQEGGRKRKVDFEIIR